MTCHRPQGASKMDIMTPPAPPTLQVIQAERSSRPGPRIKSLCCYCDCQRSATVYQHTHVALGRAVRSSLACAVIRFAEVQGCRVIEV